MPAVSRTSSPARGSARAANTTRMLRIEYKGRPYDWFNLDEMGDVVRTGDFSNTLKENITHYFGVPLECQAVYDEEGLLSSVVDFARSLRSIRPWLRVYDVREMVPELKEKTAQQLEEISADVMRSRRNFGWSTGSRSRGSSPPRLSNSMADVVRSVNESGLCIGSSHSSNSLHHPVKQASESPPRAFPWNNAGMEAPMAVAGIDTSGDGRPNIVVSGIDRNRDGIPDVLQATMLPNPMANGTSPRYATPPCLRTSQIPGVVPSSMGIPGVAPSQNGWMRTPPVDLPPSPPREVWRAQLQPMSTGAGMPQYSTPPRSMATLSNGAPLPVTERARSMASSREASPRVSTREDDCSVVEVQLAKEPPFERFGFANVPSRDGRALLVSWVDPNGLLEVKWNREHQDKRILEGDRVISVNGAGNLEEMRQQLQSKAVQLRIQRQKLE